MGLPRTAIGLFGFVLFAGFLLAYGYAGQQATSLQSEIDYMKVKQKDLVNASSQATQSDSIIGSISGVASVVANVLLLIAGFIGMLFSSAAGFLSVVTDLPIAISQIFIALLLMGMIFTLISKIVET